MGCESNFEKQKEELQPRQWSDKKHTECKAGMAFEKWLVDLWPKANITICLILILHSYGWGQTF